jgi:glutaredoxin
VIYSTPTCPDCKAAKEFFSQHNISFTEHDIATHPEKAESLEQLTGKKIVPTIVIGEKVLIGFAANRKEIENDLLHNAKKR